MAPRLGLAVLLAVTLQLCSGVQGPLKYWRTELVDGDNGPEWKLKGSREMEKDSSWGTDVKVVELKMKPVGTTDHVHKEAELGDIEDKVNAVFDFFKDNYADIEKLQSLPTPASFKTDGSATGAIATLPRNDFARHYVSYVKDGITYGDDIVFIEVSANVDIYKKILKADRLDRQNRPSRIMMSFVLDTASTKTHRVWKLTHFGPFGQNTWDVSDNKLRDKIWAKIQEYNVVKLPATVAKVNQPVGTANIDEATELGRDNKQRIAEAKYHLKAAQDAVMPNLNRLQGPRNAPALHRSLQDVKDKIDHLHNAYRLINEANSATVLAARVSVWDKPKKRKRRAAPANDVVNLGAKLELMDSDPDSEFIISKIVVKETYGNQTETHTVDFEKMVFIPDSNNEGSLLTAEFMVNGTFQPAKTDEAEKIRWISIVLSPPP